MTSYNAHFWQQIIVKPTKESSRSSSATKKVSHATSHEWLPTPRSNGDCSLSAFTTPYCICRYLIVILILSLLAVDFTKDGSLFLCYQERQGSDVSESQPTTTPCTNYLPLGLCVGILALQVVAFVPKCSFIVIAIIRVLQMSSLLGLKLIVQKSSASVQIVYASTGYFGMAVLCSFLLVELIVDKRGDTYKQKFITAVIVCVLLSTLLVTEIGVNTYQKNILIVEFVCMYGPTGLLLIVCNALMINCCQTALKHHLDPHYIASVVLCGCLTYIVIGMSTPFPAEQKIYILLSGIGSYICLWTAWCLSLPQPHTTNGKNVLLKARTVKMVTM